MSYILDALRKSEQQRQRAVVPIALIAPIAVKRPAISLSVALLLLAVGMVVGWLRPWDVPVKPATEQYSAARLALARRGKEESRPAAKPEMKPQTKPQTKPEDLPRVRATVYKPPDQTTARPAVPSVAAPAEPSVAQPQSEEGVSHVMAFNELPASIQKEIPGLTISMLSYASVPADRIAMINGSILRQGDLLPPGLRLEQIEADGVVFSYQGYRFHQSVR